MQTEKLIEIINDIAVSIGFTSCNYTIKQKTLMCQSFIDIINLYPEEMTNYLFRGKRGPSLQNKIFKRYIYLLEKSLPIHFIKGKDLVIIDSITDQNLNIFTQEQTFIQIVNNQLKVKNNTEDMYIGGRKGTCVKPYYIGKLLNISSLDGKSLNSKVQDYTFSYIKLKDVKPGTKVKVNHLGIPPHYQMGPMVYLNRIKQEINIRVKK